MKPSRKVNGLLEILIVIGLILTIPLFFAINSGANSRVAENIPTLTIAAPSFVVTPQQPPACTFPLAQTMVVESTPENYTFSEPEAVYAPDTNDGSVEIVEWLPDNQRVLIVQNIQGTSQQTIEVFTPKTGERQVYATREWTEQQPSWNQVLKAVVYPVRHVLKAANNISGFTRQAWISYGDPQSAQMIADNLSQFYVAVKPGGGQTAYLLDKQISKQNDLLKGTTPVPFNLDQWNYRKMKSGTFPLMYEMAWRPRTSQIFLYSFADINPGYTFLLDSDTGKICELNLGGWAVIARWSSNGRYLAIDSSQASGRPIGSTVLTVLDAVTGNLYTSKVVPQNLEGIRAVRGIAWAPDNRHLLVLGSALSLPQCAPNCYEDTRLYLVDFISGQVDPILSEYQFVPNIEGTNLSWSSDGSEVMVLCPALCSINVQRSGEYR
jgi:hypothetical protein